MLKNGDLIVTHCNGAPDMWNTKPPLLIWIQVLFMKILGVNELAVRLPSALAALFTGILLMVFSSRYLKKPWFGVIAAFILFTSQGYVGHHASRTGDYDSLLTLFTTAAALLFFLFCENKQTNKYLYLFYLATALAVLTKSVSGLLFLPAIFIYSIIAKQFLPLLKNKHFYIGLFSFLLLVLGYYGLREMQNPGYIAAVQLNELGGRFLETIEYHNHGFWFYYNNFSERFAFWYYLLPIGFILGILSKENLVKKITGFSALMVVTYFLVISSAQTKLEWYDVPLYPFMALLTTTIIYFIFNKLREIKQINSRIIWRVVPYIFLVLVAIYPYLQIVKKTYKPQELPWNKEFYEIGYFLKEAVNGEHNLHQQYLLYDEYNTHNLFYINILNDNGVKISLKDWRKLDVLDEVIAHQPHVKQYVEENYIHEIIETEKSIVRYRIYGKK